MNYQRSSRDGRRPLRGLRDLAHATGRFPDFQPLVPCDPGQERPAKWIEDSASMLFQHPLPCGNDTDRRKRGFRLAIAMDFGMLMSMKMTTKIDGFGRLVLPKAVRSLLGFEQDTPIKVEVIGDKIQLSVAEPPRSAIKEGSGRPVFSGKLPEQWDSGQAVLQVRSRRVTRD